MNITAKTKICMVIGNPIEHSLSPQIHNAGYEKLGIDGKFVFVACNVQIDKLDNFIKGVRSMGIRGVSCTIPHKVKVIEFLDEIDETARKIGAVNTIVNSNGVLRGYNTDWEGIVTPLENITKIKDKKVAVLGAGGAARAVVFGVMKKGGSVTIFNRTFEKAQKLAHEFGCMAESSLNIKKIKDMDIIVNATSIGLGSVKDTPLPKDFITKNHIVFDVIYQPMETQLLKDAKDKGAKIIYGFEMLLQQAIAQFKLYTNKGAPEEVMRQALLMYLKERNN